MHAGWGGSTRWPVGPGSQPPASQPRWCMPAPAPVGITSPGLAALHACLSVLLEYSCVQQPRSILPAWSLLLLPLLLLWCRQLVRQRGKPQILLQ